MTWKFISWNVNGIRAAEKKGFLDWLGAAERMWWQSRKPRRTPTSSHRTCSIPPVTGKLELGGEKGLQWHWHLYPPGTSQHHPGIERPATGHRWAGLDS